MKIIRSFPITDENLISSTIAAVDTDVVEYNPATSYALGDKVVVNSPSATVTMTIAAPCIVTWSNHGQSVKAPVVFSTSGALPTGITAGRAYFVHSVIDANRFRICARIGGAPIIATGSQSGTHTATASTHIVYESLQAANLGNTPRNSPAWWLKTGSSNRWAMFDGSVSSQSYGANAITVDIAISTVIDSLALLNLSGSSVDVVVTDTVEGEVYNQTHSLISDSGIVDPWSYFFEPINRKKNLLITDLPPCSDGDISITINEASTSNLALVGACVIGLSMDSGNTLYGAKVGIDDKSIVAEDDFGVYDIEQRDFTKRASFTVMVEKTNIRQAFDLLASLRAVAAVYVGSEDSDYDSTIIYGFPRSWDMGIDYTSHVTLNIEMRGLT